MDDEAVTRCTQSDDTGTPESYPVCTGKEKSEYCDGYSDCTSGNGYCDCDAGRQICEYGINICNGDLACPAYISGYDDFRRQKAVPMQCESDWGVSRAYSALSCCSNEGIFLVETFQIGDFDLDTNSDPFCQLYTKAMASIICSPSQGKYVQNGTLTVCMSSCQMLFDHCGFLGVDYPYTDAVSLCKEAWGGFLSSYYDQPSSFAISSGIMNVEVADGDDYCLGLIPPTQNEIDYQLNFTVPLDEVTACARGGGGGGGVGGFNTFWILVPMCAMISFAKYYWRRHRARAAEDSKAQGTTDNPVIPQTEMSTAPSIPVATAVAIGPPTVSNAPAASEPAFVSSAPFSDPLPSAPPASSFGQSATAEVDSDNPELTFDQRMDLRFLEGKLQMEMVTREEFEERKKEILSS